MTTNRALQKYVNLITNGSTKGEIVEEPKVL